MALFLQTIVPVAHHPASAAAGEGIAAANMCMAPGSLPPAPSDTDKSTGHGQQACAICQTLHMLGAGFVPPNAVALGPAALPGAGPILVATAAILDGRIVSGAQARAPPLKA